MTRKDYQMLAACFAQAEAKADNDPDTLHDIERRITLELSLDNPRFNPTRFRHAVDKMVDELTGQQ
jgi:hypothetical protein